MTEIAKKPESVTDIAADLQQLVFKHNTDERHLYPDPCQVCEILDEAYAIYERLQNINGEKV